VVNVDESGISAAWKRAAVVVATEHRPARRWSDGLLRPDARVGASPNRRLTDTCMIDHDFLSNWLDAVPSDLAAPRFGRALSRAWRRLFGLLQSD
jgi:hypothetical protein